ncbi:hypothetical protein D3C73_867930 [compost metagenome]
MGGNREAVQFAVDQQLVCFRIFLQPFFKIRGLIQIFGNIKEDACLGVLIEIVLINQNNVGNIVCADENLLFLYIVALWYAFHLELDTHFFGDFLQY